jgi:hypothetical protein
MSTAELRDEVTQEEVTDTSVESLQTHQPTRETHSLKTTRDYLNIIDAYHELGSYQAAALLYSTTDKTVRMVIERHEAGGPWTRRPRLPATKNTDPVWQTSQGRPETHAWVREADCGAGTVGPTTPARISSSSLSSIVSSTLRRWTTTSILARCPVRICFALS